MKSSYCQSMKHPQPWVFAEKASLNSVFLLLHMLPELLERVGRNVQTLSLSKLS